MDLFRRFAELKELQINELRFRQVAVAKKIGSGIDKKKWKNVELKAGSWSIVGW